MFSAADLTAEIRRIIDRGLDEERPQPVDEIVNAVVMLHPFPPDWRGEDREFAELAVHSHVMVEVRKKLREYRVSDEENEANDNEPRQARLPGFEHLQRGYLLIRGGKRNIVPLRQMTDGELILVAERVRVMERGCHDHAEELDRYRIKRAAGELPAPAAAA